MYVTYVVLKWHIEMVWSKYMHWIRYVWYMTYHIYIDILVQPSDTTVPRSPMLKHAFALYTNACIHIRAYAHICLASDMWAPTIGLQGNGWWGWEMGNHLNGPMIGGLTNWGTNEKGTNEIGDQWDVGTNEVGNQWCATDVSSQVHTICGGNHRNTDSASCPRLHIVSAFIHTYIRFNNNNDNQNNNKNKWHSKLLTALSCINMKHFASMRMKKH